VRRTFADNQKLGAPLLAIFARGGCMDRPHRRFPFVHPDQVTIVDSNRLSTLVVAKTSPRRVPRITRPLQKRTERGALGHIKFGV
jgi:hypothetical protein